MENTHIKTEETPVTSNSETATASATDSNVVTSSSPTPTSSAFQPFQQLHEAVLAAVNSHSIPISHQSFMEAVAAATNQVNSQTQPVQQQSPTPQQQPIQPLSDAEYAKKESIRASNRERKKKWRIHNEERNKDNDLRCRVNKRANKLFGLAESANKAAWVQDEFEKRRQKRMDKERRKLIVNNVLSVPGSENNNGVSMPNIVSSGQIPTFYTPLPQIDTATAAKLLDFPTDLQRQLLEQLNNSMMALTNGIQQAAPETEESKAQMVDQAIHNLVASSQAESSSSSSNANTSQSVTTSSDIPTASSTTTTVTAVPDTASAAAESTAANNETTIAETSSTTPTTTATTTIIQEPAQNNNSSNTSDASSGHNSPYPNEEADKQEENAEEGKEEKKPEYPMDAVLTLMQLNAGWRQ
ncbi:hypothetical protein K501DRAFT_338320 [Backusella circina FSU 941]|nr:hypothetical protein K501DRAFT_338320 [Backusella circina FSU 941]